MAMDSIVAMKFAILLCFFGAALSSPACKVRDWEEWSECQSAKPCTKHNAKSHPTAGVTSAPDVGRLRMQRMMAQKEAHWRWVRSCREDGTCPEMSPGRSGGPAPCVNGEAGPVDGRTFPCSNLDLAYYVNIEELSGGEADEGNDIWGWTDPVTGDEYAIMGVNWGTSFIRITDPENPVVVAYLSTNTGPSLWRDMKVVGDHVFIVSEATGHGMQVYDLSLLRESNGFQVVEATAVYEQFGNAHNIVAGDGTGFVYVVGATQVYDITCGGGLLAIDVSNPTTPLFAGCYGDDGYTHDAQCIIYNGPDTEHVGKEICFAYNEDTLTIVDVTDKSNMFYISRTTYDGASYSHQGWVTEDHTVLLLDDELDEIFGISETTVTYIWDVSDLDAPVLQNSFISTETVPDHNQYIRANRAYQSNYQAGLRVLNIDQDNYDLDEVAFFDVSPLANAMAFAGSWSNYPYFQSGIIPVSSMEYGLFLLRPNESGIQRTLAQKGFGQQTRSTTDDHCPSMTETRKCLLEKC